MPPRFAYWTIILDDGPTAFRARDRAELMGVFRQLANRNPTAAIKWFAHGKLWESPEEERAAARAAAQAQREARGPDWRPGGKHEDPRARFDKRHAKRGHEHARRHDAPAERAPDQRPDGARRDAKPGGPKPRPWDRGHHRDRNNRRPGVPGRPAPRSRAVGRPRAGGGETPSEPQPPAPPQPPGPERPPKPGQEPAPDRPQPETIRILPEPPERATPAPKKP